MGKLIAIALNTFREAIRNKILYSLLFFSLAVIIASLAFGALSVHEELRLTTDLGLGGMSMFSIIIAVFVGVNLLYKELERKTVYTLIPKPIHRYQFVLGKYLGMLITLAVQVVIMSVVLAAVLYFQGGGWNMAMQKMAVLIFLEVMLITAIAVLFSSFSTPFLSGLFTIGIFLVGRSIPDIITLANKMRGTPLANMLRGVASIIPDLRYFYVTGADSGEYFQSVHAAFPDWAYVGWAGLYAGLYIVVLLMAAMLFFSRRDFI